MTKFKLTLVTLSIILCSTLAQAQVETFFSKLLQPYDLALKDDTLYVTAYEQNSIYKIGKSADKPDTILVVKGLNSPIGLALDGNDLYISESGAKKISKIDISSPNPMPIDVVTGLAFAPFYIHLHNDILYLSTLITNEIYKIDLTAQNKTAVEFVTGTGSMYGLAVYNNFLYISEYKNNKISKIELSSTSKVATEVISGLDKPIYLKVKDSDLLFTEASKISKIDLTSNNPTAKVVTTGLNLPHGLAFHGEVLFITEILSGLIRKHTASNSTETINTNKGITIYPNPASERVQVAGLSSSQNYAIYSVLGLKVQEGTIEPGKRISIKQLSTGLYLLKLDNGFTGKFIKE